MGHSCACRTPCRVAAVAVAAQLTQTATHRDGAAGSPAAADVADGVTCVAVAAGPGRHTVVVAAAAASRCHRKCGHAHEHGGCSRCRRSHWQRSRCLGRVRGTRHRTAAAGLGSRGWPAAPQRAAQRS
eukprot:scaffold1875_cov339-Prasinococcus_capsulatus_cf.AAC.13